MGLSLYPGLLKKEAESAIEAMHSDNHGLLDALESINNFILSDELQGKGWQAVRKHMAGHALAVESVILANSEAIKANEELIESVGDEDLDEEALRRSIEALESVNNSCGQIAAEIDESLFANDPGILELSEEYMALAGDVSRKIAVLNEKIARLYRIEAETSGLFDKALSLYERANDAMQKVKKEFDASSGTYVFASGDSEWRKSIESDWLNSSSGIYGGYGRVEEEAGISRGAAKALNRLASYALEFAVY